MVRVHHSSIFERELIALHKTRIKKRHYPIVVFYTKVTNLFASYIDNSTDREFVTESSCYSGIDNQIVFCGIKCSCEVIGCKSHADTGNKQIDFEIIPFVAEDILPFSLYLNKVLEKLIEFKTGSSNKQNSHSANTGLINLA